MRDRLLASLARVSLGTAFVLSNPASGQVVSSVTCDVGDLRAAIDAANAGGGGTLSLAAACVYDLTDRASAEQLGFFLGPNGLPVITSPITILGNGATIQRNAAAPEFRLFMIAGPAYQVESGYPATGTLALNDLTLSGGLALGGDGADGGGGGAEMGGAILVAGSASLDTVTITNCEAHGGEGAPGQGGGGGGLRGNGGSAGFDGGGGGGGFVGTAGGGGDGGGGGGGGALGAGAAASAFDPGAGGSIDPAVGTTPGSSGVLAAPWSDGGVPGGPGGVGGGGGGGDQSDGGGGGFGGGGGGGGGGSSDGGPGGVGGGGGGSVVDGSGGDSILGGGGSGTLTGGDSEWGGGGAPAGTSIFGGTASETEGGGGAGVGGSIFVADGGTLTVANGTFQNNVAAGGTGGNAGQGKGGAVFVMGGATVKQCNGTYSGNTASTDAGVPGFTNADNDDVWGTITDAPELCSAPSGIPVAATKLVVVDKGASGAKVVFVAKDPAVTKGAGTDTATIGVTLDFDYTNGTDPPSAGQFVAVPGSVNWLVNDSTVARYVNKTAPTGGGTKVAVIKPGKLVKLVGKNRGDTPIDVLNQSGAVTGVANAAYCIENGPDINCFCSTFPACAWKSTAAGTKAKLVCKNGTGDAACAALTP